ncbi:MAG: formylglycine-generating enzyme family protein [Bryobacteraceae bacterium]
MNPFRAVSPLFTVVAAGALLLAQDTPHQPQGNQFPGPGQGAAGLSWLSELRQWVADPGADREAWLRDLKIWRHERLTRMGYDDSEYRRPEFQWAQRDFFQPQMMAEERYFYDPVKRGYTVGRYLDDLEKRFGGIDAVLIWPVYPNIGIDNRNLWDLHRDLPGGIPALRKMIEDFHKRNVRVLFPTMPWDNGTRDPGMPYWEATARLMADVGADGVNGDTFAGLPRSYRTASDRTGHPVIFQPEGPPLADEGLAWNNQSWGHFTFTFVPAVSKQKWLEPRHMINISDRWARDKTDDLQFAFFNGIGWECWENIWGIWNQITPRDAEATRRIARIYRAFPEMLVSPDWEPHTPTIQYGVYASKWPAGQRTLWTIVNRNEYNVAGEQIVIPAPSGRRFYDLWNGAELAPGITAGKATLSFAIEGNGFGAILAVDGGAAIPGLHELLVQMHEWANTPLKSLSHEWRFLPQQMVEIARSQAASSAPAGMIKIPSGDFNFKVTGIEIEGTNWEGLDFQYPWENSPRRGHEHRMTVASFYIDKYPVTNAEFKKFLDAASYHPADDHNFLRDWKSGTPPVGWENKPVTWVSLEDARAYAAWAGKRLPHEWEWQYAAQGTDGRRYPWGNTWSEAAAPAPVKGRDLTSPTPVDAHPSGASPFGVMDLVGNVWQWTDEFVDDHTRAAALRGGSYYQPQGSIWYFPQAYRLTEHGKYLLMAPSKDRAGTLGFRCVKDAN